MTVYTGAPQDLSAYSEAEQKAYRLLERLHIPYQRVEHEPADTMEQCQAIGDALQVRICKNLFLCNRQKTAFYLLMMPGDKPFRTKQLSAQINSARLSFASAEDMQWLLGVTPGSVSVLGLANDTAGEVRLLVDEDLLRDEWIGCHPCRNTGSLRLPARAVWDIIVPDTGHTVTPVRLTAEVEML